jgi:hypothetical protein
MYWISAAAFALLLVLWKISTNSIVYLAARCDGRSYSCFS